MKPSHSGSQRESQTVADKVSDWLCAVNGLSTGLSHRQRSGLRISSFTMWFIAVGFGTYSICESLWEDIFLETYPVNLTIMTILTIESSLNFVSFYWRLQFLLRNEHFGSLRLEGEKKSRNLIFQVTCFFLFLAPDLHEIYKAHGWLRRLGLVFCLISSSSLLNFYILFDEAVSSIVERHESLLHSIRSSKNLNVIDFFREKLQLRRRCEEVNELFALPLATFFSILFLTVLQSV